MPFVRTLLSFIALGGVLVGVATADPCEHGEQRFREGDYLAAEPLLRQCLEQDESLGALLPLTVITVVQERGSEGMVYGSRAFALAPDNVQVRYWYGRAHMVIGDIGAAQEQWEAGLLLDPTHAGILEALGHLSLQQGEDARAYNLFLQLRLQGSDELWLHRMLSDLARRRALWDKASIHWQDVVTLEGETEENLVILGELEILAGEVEKAVATFEHAVVVLPSAATFGGLGEAWFAKSEFDSATVALQRAVELDPSNAHNRFNLANALQIQGDLTGAEEQFTAYLEAVPDDPVGHFKYGVHLELRDEVERALAEVEHAVTLDPKYLEALIVLAQMYEMRDLAGKALATIDRLETLDPGAATELAAWRTRIEGDRAVVQAELAVGKVRLMHIVMADPGAIRVVIDELARGEDFGALASRFSSGATAARGGDIGWVDPAHMLAPMRAAIRRLDPGQVSDPIVVDGVTHLFKRVH